MSNSALLAPPRPSSSFRRRDHERGTLRRSTVRALLEGRSPEPPRLPSPVVADEPSRKAAPVVAVDVVVDEAPRAFTLVDAAIAGGLVLMAASALVGAGLGAPSLVALAAAAGVPTIVLVALTVWGLLALGCLYMQTRLWWAYRPVAHDPSAPLPTMTVVIPAYNEGAMVARSIESVARAAYARERLEVFVVDDGSTDDTWAHIERVASDYPGLVTAVRQPENRGKRAALEVGFRRARGEVLVTIDSDSVIEPQTLLSLAAPFRDPKVGAVAGRVAVYNRAAGLLPRMLHVVFTLSFDFHRAAQSGYGTVYCCPGALTAYRASVVRQVLEPWLAQRFLGVPCTVGEDRALTNSVLATGHDAVYQRTAVVHTIVPERHAQLCKMFLRWDRSYVREELRFAGIVWRRSGRALALALFEAGVRNLGLPLRYVSLGLVALLAVHDPRVLLGFAGLTVVGALLRGLYFLRAERSSEALLTVLYALYFTLGLSWIFPYAALTVRARGWLTR